MAKQKQNNGRRQGELAGFERKRIDVLEDLIAKDREAIRERQEAKVKARETRIAVQEGMRGVEGELGKDENGDPCYLYVDGEIRELYVLESSEGIVVRKLKQTEPPPGAAID